MAKKSRTPPPPRRVQVPKTRTGGTGTVDRRRLAIVVGAAVLGFIGLGAAVGIYVVTGAEGGSGVATLEAAGCTVQTFPGQQGNHVTALPEGYEYNSDPPTSGVHNPQPAPWDVYDEPVDQLIVVHNLEHGGVVIQYGDDVPDSDVAAMIDWYRDDPNGIVIAPRPALGNRIALEAWIAEGGENGTGVLVKCPRFDEKAFDAFVDEYGFRGPEPFDRDALQPGQF